MCKTSHLYVRFNTIQDFQVWYFQELVVYETYLRFSKLNVES